MENDEARDWMVTHGRKSATDKMVSLARVILLFALYLANGLRMGIRLTSASDCAS